MREHADASWTIRGAACLGPHRPVLASGASGYWAPSMGIRDVAAIDALDKGVRGGTDPAALSLETYPKIIDNSDG